MDAIDSENFMLSVGEQVGLVSFLIAGFMLFFDLKLFAIPLAGFILLCIVAPFFPRFGFYLPIISRGTTGKSAVALTFDDGPDPMSTPQLLELLLKYQIKATFFVTGKKAAEHPKLIEEILLHGHSIGNHSYVHNNLVMFKSCESIAEDIEATQNVLDRFGVMALAFRPPVGITGPRLRSALKKSDKFIVNFSCRAFDGGNRWIKGLSKKILKRIRPGDIVLLHDVRPHQPTLLAYWLNEIEFIISGIKGKGLAVLPLAEMIGRPVMIINTGGVKEER